MKNFEDSPTKWAIQFEFAMRKWMSLQSLYTIACASYTSHPWTRPGQAMFGNTGVIKFWGPRENGDPTSPISTGFWGPFCENGDPFRRFKRRSSVVLSVLISSEVAYFEVARVDTAIHMEAFPLGLYYCFARSLWKISKIALQSERFSLNSPCGSECHCSRSIPHVKVLMLESYTFLYKFLTLYMDDQTLPAS